ncbi:MAG: hypothetical protein II799_01310 [Lachnospiraceae bacterium]|nr:hypothetical protein [Lachnospiraceae bacterium]
MDEHGKKKIAPVIITVVVVIYYLAYFGFMITMLPMYLKLLLGIVPLAVAGGMIYVCIERLKEIDDGEEDDISKY